MASTVVDLTHRTGPVGLITSTSIPLELSEVTRELIIVENEEILVERGNTPGGAEVVRVMRSRPGMERPPHLTNYRAMLRALKAAGAERVVATSTAGALQRSLGPGTMMTPDQMVLWSRVIHTTYSASHFGFADMTNPYCAQLREALVVSGESQGRRVASEGTYFSVSGPRYETAAEATMFANLGGSVVGMTNGPECIFARELGLCYASLVLVTNFGAGIAQSVEIEHVKYAAKAHAADVANVIFEALDRIEPAADCGCSKPTTVFGPSIDTKA